MCSSEKSQLKAKCFQKELKLKIIHRGCDSRESIPRAKTEENLNHSKFGTIFTATELQRLRTFNVTKIHDSTFILNVVKFLYKDNLEKLSKVSLTGLSTNEKKERISPAHYDIIKQLFRIRLESLSLDTKEFILREKALHKHIKSAIFNLSKKGTPVNT